MDDEELMRALERESQQLPPGQEAECIFTEIITRERVRRVIDADEGEMSFNGLPLKVDPRMAPETFRLGIRSQQ